MMAIYRTHRREVVGRMRGRKQATGAKKVKSELHAPETRRTGGRLLPMLPR